MFFKANIIEHKHIQKEMINLVKHQNTLSYGEPWKGQKMSNPEKNRNGTDVFSYLNGQHAL